MLAARSPLSKKNENAITTQIGVISLNTVDKENTVSYTIVAYNQSNVSLN